MVQKHRHVTLRFFPVNFFSHNRSTMFHWATRNHFVYVTYAAVRSVAWLRDKGETKGTVGKSEERAIE